MKTRSLFRQYARAIHHFTRGRAAEVLALQAAPFLGALIAGIGEDWRDLVRLTLLLGGSVALTAHVFILNDWAGRSSDLRDPRRAMRVFLHHEIVLRLSIALSLVAITMLTLVGVQAALFGAAIATLSVLYSCGPRFGKGMPIVGSLIHVIGGALHFLLGYSVVGAVNGRALVVSLFFGLVFAGGHLNQEVRDFDGDARNSIRTNAVVFGCRRTLVASFFVFTIAYATLIGLAALGILPRALLWCALLWPLHLAWSLRAILSEPGFDTACWMQKRYRLLFAVVGLAMIATASSDSPLVRTWRHAADDRDLALSISARR